MDRRPFGDLPRDARIKRRLEQLRTSRPVRREKYLAPARKKRALQKIAWMIDSPPIRYLPDLRTRHPVEIRNHPRPRYKSRPFASASILRSATDRLSIQN